MACGAILSMILAVAGPRTATGGGPATQPATVSPKQFTTVVRADRAEYEIRVGGTMDADNTHVYGDVYQPGFQPNIELTITNVGDVPVKDPRMSINDTGDWFDMPALVAASVGRARGSGDEEKSYALWDFFRRNIDAGPSYSETCWGDTRSFGRFMNCFGSGACGTFHIVMPYVGRDAGLETASGCLADCSHAVQTEVYGGADRFFDALIRHDGGEQPRGYVPLELDNRSVASVADLMADHYLVERIGTSPGFYGNVTYFGPGSSFYPTRNDKWSERRTMGITLRPGESLRRTWTPVAKGWLPEAPSPASSGQGAVIYEPVLTRQAVARDAASHENLTFEGGIAAAGPGPGQIVYEVYCPYVLIAAAMDASFVLPASGFEAARIRWSFDGNTWIEKWRAGSGGAQRAAIRDDESPEFHQPRLAHRVWFRLELPSGGRLTALRMETIFQSYVPSLPGLRLGVNKVKYRNSTAGPHAVRIDHRWRESSAYAPPTAPAQALHPVDGGEAGFAPTFRWERPAGDIERHEFFLSPREDLAWPVLAPFHCILKGDEPRFTPAVVDALNDGQRYYWRVRARGKGGVWSDWSKVWCFTARGPGRPINARIETSGGREILAWDAPPSGQPAERYEVYASTDSAVSPRREPRLGQAAGTTIELPATLIGTSQGTSFEIPSRPEVFYRVVAVDRNDSRSPPTAMVAAARPVWLPVDPPPLTPGVPYRFTPRVRHTTGRWVLSLRQGVVRHGADILRFQRLEGPDWLKVNTETGELAGTPPTDLQTPVRVTLLAEINQVGSAQRSFEIPRR